MPRQVPGEEVGEGLGGKARVHRHGDDVPAVVPQMHFINEVLMDLQLGKSRCTTTRHRMAATRCEPRKINTQRGAARTVPQAKQRCVRTERVAGNMQAKDHHKEGPGLIDSAFDVMEESSADTSDKTVKGSISLRFDMSTFILNKPTQFGTHSPNYPARVQHR